MWILVIMPGGRGCIAQLGMAAGMMSALPEFNTSNYNPVTIKQPVIGGWPEMEILAGWI
jgi:hypothetical protein